MQAKDEERYAKHIKPYKDLLISNEQFDIFPCPSVLAMAEEGYAMDHCVYRCRYDKKPNSLILFVRNKKGEREATVEWFIKQKKINQCYTYHDHVHKYDKEIRKLIEDNAELINNPGKKAKTIALKPKHKTAPTTKQLALTA